MKAAKRSILICVLTLILSVSLLAGVTFAWFTDSITNSGNTIQSGELAIDATAYDRVDAAETDGLTVTIGEGNVASGTYYFEAEGASLRNGDPVITEENWQPGDMNAKLFTVSNEGSIDAVVSLDFFVSGDLAEAMWYDFIAVNPADGSLLGEFLQRNDLNTISDLADSYGEVTLEPEEQVTFLFVYGLPTSATNEAMNKAVNVNVVVSAKQNVEGAEGPVSADEVNSVVEAVQNAESNSTVVLSGSDYEVSQPVVIENKENIVIDGNGATIKASSAEGASIMSATSKSIAVAADTQTDLANNIINVSGATNVTIRNLTIEGALHHGINIWECENVVIENVTIINSDATAITINGSNVTLNSVTTSGSGWGGVNVDLGNSGSSEITVDENCAFGEFLPIYADSKAIAAHITVNVPENYNKAIVDLTGIGEDGVERVVWSSTIVETADELNSALFDGGNIIIANDMTVNSFAGYYRQISTDVTVYLNNKTVTSTQTQNTTINGYSTLNLVYGSLVFNNMEAVHAASLLPITGSTVTLDNVKLTSNGTALYPRGDAAAVNVFNHSVVEGGAYAIGTNAGSTNNYNVIVTIKDSTVQTEFDGETTGGGTAILFNVPGTLNVENSTVAGVQNAVAARVGTVNIKNSTLTTTEQQLYPDFDSFMVGANAEWETGNAFPYATLLVGNKPNMNGSNDGYQNAATVTVENTTITSNNADVPAIYIWGNAKVNEGETAKGATLTVDEFTWTNKTGALAGDPAGTYGDVTVNLPEGYTLVDSYEELATAARGGGYIVLANDLNNVSLNIPISGVDTVVDLNGKTIYMTGYHAISFYAFGITDGTLKVFNGTIDATRASNRVDGLVANGNSKLTLSNLAIKSADGCLISQNANNDITIDNCDIESDTYYAVYQNGSYAPNTITIKNSNIIGGVYVSNSAGREKQTLIIDNCTISGGSPTEEISTALEIKHTNATVTNTTLIGVGETATYEEGSGGCTLGYAFAVTSNSSADSTTGEVILTNCTLLHKDTLESETTDTGSVFVFTIAEGEGNSVTINGTPANETVSYGAQA